MNAPVEQIPFDLGHRPAQGREDFLVAPPNQDAVNWIDRWPDWSAPSCILYGPVACGKSHLASVWKDQTGAAFVNGNALISTSADVLATKATHLVLDNVDLWFGDRAAETTLFHLYNLLKEQGGRSLLLTMHMAPTHASFILPDLASRLRAAPAASIQAPDEILLAAILVKLFSDRQLQVGQDVLSYILPRMERSFAAARDLVEQADRLALAGKRPISISLIRKVLSSRAL